MDQTWHVGEEILDSADGADAHRGPLERMKYHGSGTPSTARDRAQAEGTGEPTPGDHGSGPCEHRHLPQRGLSVGQGKGLALLPGGSLLGCS